MSRLVAFTCNDHSLTPVAVRVAAASLDIPDVDETSGFGFGWIQDGRTLLRTHPRPTAGAPQFLDLMADIPARSIIGHYRDFDEGSASTRDMQPFRFRSWVVAHAGEAPETDASQTRLLAAVPEFVRGNVKGTSGAEVAGHLFLGRLYEAGLLDQARTAPARVADVMGASLRELSIQAAVVSASLVGVTERMLVAATLGRPLYYRLQLGISRDSEKPLFAGHTPKAVNHPTFKALVVTDSPDDVGAWEEVPDAHSLTIDRDWNLLIRPIAE